MTLAHDVHGAGPALLLVHGMSLDRRMWDPNLAALTERHTVVRCDLRGFGATPPPDGPYSHADDLRALLAELGIARAAVAGRAARDRRRLFVLALVQRQPARRARPAGGPARRRGRRADARAVGRA